MKFYRAIPSKITPSKMKLSTIRKLLTSVPFAMALVTFTAVLRIRMVRIGGWLAGFLPRNKL